jgi:acetyl-CoA carboxylase biotin carboxylase subunit
LRQRGHAIECRVYAEDPDRNFLPCPGRIEALRVPGGPGVRDDSGVYGGYEVPIHYDPLISKLVCYGHDRPDALARMRRALGEYKVRGISTTLPFFERVLGDPDFVAGDFDTGFVERLFAAAAPDRVRSLDVAVAAAAIGALRERQAARLASHASQASTSGWWRAGLGDAQRGR